jgi:hypothetical protein
MSRKGLTDEDLGERLTSLDDVAGDGGDCPPPEQLWAFARGELERADGESLILHIGECTACASECRMARDLVAESRSVATPVSAKKTRFPRAWIPLAAAAAVVVGMLGLWQYHLSSRQATSPVLRTPMSDWIRPLTDQDLPLPRDGFTLRWTPGPEGTTYDVLVTTEDLDPLAQASRLERPELQLAAEALDDRPAGSRVLWQITAHPPEGPRVISRTFVTRIE